MDVVDAVKATCPRRMLEIGPHLRQPNLDAWEDWHGEWKGYGSAPRVCSFCGSAHPDDAVNLVENYGYRLTNIVTGFKATLENGIPDVKAKLFFAHLSDDQKTTMLRVTRARKTP